MAKIYLAKQQLLETELIQRRRLLSIFHVGTGEQEAKWVVGRGVAGGGGGGKAQDTFLPPRYAPILVASMQRTSIHRKMIHFAHSFSNAFKHFGRNPFICVDIEPNFWSRPKLVESCFAHCAVTILAHP